MFPDNIFGQAILFGIAIGVVLCVVGYFLFTWIAPHIHIAVH